MQTISQETEESRLKLRQKLKRGHVIPVLHHAVSGLSLFLLITLTAPVYAVESVTIGVLAKRGADRALQQWTATADYLSTEIPEYQFSIKPLGFEEMEHSVATQEVDLLLTNPGIYVQLEYQLGVSRIATLKNRILGKPSAEFSSVVFARADRPALKQWSDLEGLHLRAVNPDSLGGYLMVLREAKQLGFELAELLGKISFAGTHDQVVYAVLNGESEVGVVRTDTLERMSAEGRIELDQIQVLAYQSAGDPFPFLRSTRTYPEWPMARLQHTPPGLAEAVAGKLLSMSAESEAARQSGTMGWTTPLNYQPVHELFRELQLPPYPPVAVTFSSVYKQYKWTIIVASIGLLLIFLIAIKLYHSNTHLYQTRKQLQQNEDELKSILSSIDESVVVVDQDNRITLVNLCLCKITGWSRQQLLGKSISMLLKPSSEAGNRSPVGLLELVGDRLQQVHDDNHDLFHQYLRDAPMPLLVVDITHPRETLPIFLSSQDLAFQLGYDKAELSRLTLADLLPTEDLQPVTSQLLQMGEKGKRTASQLYRWKSKSGQLIKHQVSLAQVYCGRENHVLISVDSTASFPWELVGLTHFGQLFAEDKISFDLLCADQSQIPVQINASIHQNGEKVEGAVLAIHDLREYLSAENERRANLAKDEFVASMSHELRTPLATIIGNTEHLLRSQFVNTESPAAREVVEVLQSSHRAGMRQLYLVNDILDMYKIESGKFSIDPSPYDLTRLTTDVIEIFDLRAKEAGLTLELQQQPGSNQLLGDATRISQILINLLSNALKFTLEGTVRLVVEIEEETLRFRVEDSGIGISEADQQRLFGRFEQAGTDTNSQLDYSTGTGLGLYISRQLAQAMGGTLTVESSKGEGSIFTLTLPCQPAEVDEVAVNTSALQEGGGRSYHGTVLIAEDDYELQLMERRILEEVGLRVDIAANGKEAVSMAEQHRYDLILMDMQMPEMDGITATKTLRAEGVESPVVALTANVMQKHRDEFESVGVTHFLSKPIELNKLHAVLERFLEKATQSATKKEPPASGADQLDNLINGLLDG